MEVLRISPEWSLIDALLGCGLVQSRSEARRLSKQGAVRLDDIKLPEFFEPYIIDIYSRTDEGIYKERFMIEESKLIEVCKTLKEMNNGNLQH